MTETARLRLKVQLALEIDADDFIEAANHQRQLEDILASMRRLYPLARLIITERRGRGVRPTAVLRGRSSGALNVYDDA